MRSDPNLLHYGDVVKHRDGMVAMIVGTSSRSFFATRLSEDASYPSSLYLRGYYARGQVFEWNIGFGSWEIIDGKEA